MTPDWQPPTERRVVHIREGATTRDIFPSCERCGTELTGKQKTLVHEQLSWAQCGGQTVLGNRTRALLVWCCMTVRQAAGRVHNPEGQR